MSIYFDNVVKSQYKDIIHTNIAWHPEASCLAVAGYSAEKGGIVTILTGEGKPCEDVDIPPHPTAQVTVLAWHPYKRIIAIGWDSGELFIFNDHEHELHEIKSLHRSPISVLQFSLGGKRLVTGDTSGSLIGWNADSNGFVQTAFTHDLKDFLSQMVFRVTIGSDKLTPPLDLSGLARAAVQGDEQALDIFSTWRPKTGHKRTGQVQLSADNANFYLGSTTGILYHVNESGNCVEVLQAEGGVKRLLHHKSRNLLVVITEGLVLGQFSVDSDGSVKEITKVKLSGRSSDIQVSWATSGLLAVTTGDGFVRLWSLDSGENYILDLRESFGYKSHEHIMCLSYCHPKRTLCAGTNMGNIAMWKHDENNDEQLKDPEKDWKLQPPTVLSVSISQVAWGSSQNLIAANTGRDIFILNEQDMVASYKDQVGVVQVSPVQLMVDVFSADTHLDLTADLQIGGVHNSMDHIIVWNKKIQVYEINSDASQVKLIESFPCETNAAVVHESSIYSIEGKSILVRSFGGNVRQTLAFTDAEGEPIYLSICGNFLIVATIHSIIKLWDLSKKEAKVHHPGKQMNELIREFGEIISAQCNCTGTRVSVVVAKSSLVPDPKIYIWDLENDAFTYFNFSTGQTEEDDGDGSGSPKTAETSTVTHQDRTKKEAAKEVAGRFVLCHYWDAEDHRLLVCEAKLQPKEKKDRHYGHRLRQEMASHVEAPPLMLVSIFVTGDRGMVVQEAFAMLPQYTRLIGVQVPFIYLLNNPDIIKEKGGSPMAQRVMRDFVGLEDADQPTKEAMLNFSFFLSISNMDEAFKAIKTIKSETVWENMAKMCVKTKRLDVAFLCLGNMGHARGARALRKAMDELELDARVAMLAIQLGMIEDAERLYVACGRYDLLNQMYQDAGMWSQALEVAEREDRIHLRSTHYNYAKHLESKGDYSSAISHYEKSDTYKFEVPRMLFDELPTLEDYIMHTDDKGLRKWWAQYLESTGEMETALQFYEAAGDHLSLVRVHCYCNNLEKAAEIANRTDDRAACYHLARQYENIDMVREAIHFFSRAHAYGNAIRICKENNFDDQLMNLALVAGPQEQIDAARYFTNAERPQISRAVTLFHKAGLISKAVNLAFQSGQVSMVAQIASELDETADPAVIQRCVQYFISISQYDKAVNLLITGKQYIQALDLCIQNNVRVTEEMAEKFTLPKDGAARNEILEKVAECAYAQENYKLATKKFTQAGNKIKAMKCLLKSGDTERIVYFANVCRQPDIYIMAANYLQGLDIRKEPEIMRNVVIFYTRAKAYRLLSAFYDSCAQIEIDEYQNYEKAAVALKEAFKCLTEIDDPQVEQRRREIHYKLEKVKQFLDLKVVLNDSKDPDSAIRELYSMMGDSQVESAVRQGDIFATIIEYFASQGNFKSALGTLQEMKNKLPKVNPSYFVSAEALEAISRASGVPLGGGLRRDGKEEDGGESGEEVIEEEEEEPGNQMPVRRLLNGSAKFL